MPKPMNETMTLLRKRWSPKTQTWEVVERIPVLCHRTAKRIRIVDATPLGSMYARYNPMTFKADGTAAVAHRGSNTIYQIDVASKKEATSV
jgi:hypothetical protein